MHLERCNISLLVGLCMHALKAQDDEAESWLTAGRLVMRCLSFIISALSLELLQGSLAAGDMASLDVDDLRRWSSNVDPLVRNW